MVKKSSITDLLFTFSTQLVVTLLGILLLTILSRKLPEEGLGAYLVIRRIVGLAFPIITLNLGMSMARHISFDFNKAERYFAYSYLIISFFVLILLVGLPLYKTVLARVLFGGEKYSTLILPGLIFLYSSSFQVICSGYHRGKHDYFMMNLINLLFWLVGLITLSIMLFEIESYLDFLGLFFVTYAFLNFLINWIIILRKGYVRKTLASHFKKIIKISNYTRDKEFVRYGVSRLPHGFFLALIFLIPIVAASSFMSLKAAAYIGIIVTIIRMIQMFGVPFNLIFLPKFSYFKSKNDEDLIQHYSQIVLEYIFTFPILIGFLIYFMSPEIIFLWFGNKYTLVIDYLKFIGPLTGLLLGYILIRGILDGIYDFPYSNIITFSGVIGVGTLSSLSIIHSWDLLGLTISFGAGIVILGVSSIYILVKKQKLIIFNLRNISAIIWGMLIMVIFTLYNKYFIIESIYFSLILKTLFSILIMFFSFLYYKKMNFQWISELELRFK